MNHLLALSIGPVQPFIEAARRTADLSAGSQLLVDIAKAAAESIKVTDSHSRLIFPALVNGAVTDGPNKILARVAGDPAKIADAARDAAQRVLKSAWHDALSLAGPDRVNTQLAVPQVETFLEFYAAWVPLADDEHYSTARAEVELLLAGRKTLRDFQQPISQAGVPKSPLDPARDSVIREPSKCAGRPLFLKPAEHLDAVSLIKRVRGRTNPAKSTTELAATVLMKLLEAKAPAETQSLRSFAKPIEGVDAEDLLYPGRRDDAVKSGEMKEEQAAEAQALAEKALKRAGLGKAPPDWAAYYAIIVADGDKMGERLSQLNHPDDHIELSSKLSRFAKDAWQLVKDHGGHCVYSGGDDVMALLPAQNAVACAAGLANKFHHTIGCTLSVGVAIVHYLDPLRVSLERARAAEREAKKKRNSLAVALHTRGGEPRIAAEPWSDEHSIQTWEDWTAAFRGKEGLSHGFPYELRHLAREARETLPAQSDKPAAVLDAATLQEEALRILARKQGGADDGQQQTGFLASLKKAISGVNSPEDLERLVAKLVICRFLAQIPEVK